MAKVRKELASIFGGAGDAVSAVGDRFGSEGRATRKAERKLAKEAAELIKPELKAAHEEVVLAHAEATAKITAARTEATVNALKAEGERAAAAIKAAAEPASAAKAGRLAKGLSAAKSVPGSIIKAPLKAGLWVAEQPIALALKPVKWVANGVTGFAAKNPPAAVAIGAGAAAVAVGSFIANRGSKRMMAQGEAIQQMQAMQAMAPQQSSGLYKNNPEASQAFVDARIAADRANGNGPVSQQDALAARQQQAAAAEPTPSAL